MQYIAVHCNAIQCKYNTVQAQVHSEEELLEEELREKELLGTP